MPYVAYHKETTEYLPVNKQAFATERAAKSAITRAYNDGKIANRDDYAVADAHVFVTNIEKQVERVNLMSGKKYMESVNTPCYCSPAFESYWSM